MEPAAKEHIIEFDFDRDEGHLDKVSYHYHEVLLRARNAFFSQKTKSYDFRKSQLQQLEKMCKENGEVLAAALHKDFRKSRGESYMGEINVVINEARHAVRDLKSWMKPEKVDKTVPSLLDEAIIHKDPRGVVLIIGSWNYPIQLVLMPLIGAIAAGNCALIKPSELAPASSNILSDLIPKYLDKDCYHVVEGGPEETRRLLKEKFDYIFYTGSTRVGKLIRAAANEHLTPVTLELGGKSPLYIDDSVDMAVAARRILWGKYMNAGQTCIAPDYILCSKSVQTDFIEEARKVIKEWYSDDPKKSPDLCRIINDNHFKRLQDLMRGSVLAIGGDMDECDKYVAPTVVINVKPTDPIMSEEIFGPILPIVNIESPLEAIKFIMERESPLTLYVFTTDTSVQQLFIGSTTSGSICVNDTLTQFLVDTLPFGGVGGSGIGAYHGKYSFDTFTHHKSVLIKDYNPVVEFVAANRYPPYTDKKMKMIEMGLGIPLPHPSSRFFYFVFFVVGLIAGAACFYAYMNYLKDFHL